MKEKILYIVDQFLFSAVNFIVFVVLDYKFDVDDVAQYAIMISAAAFLLNFGFAIKVERLLFSSDRLFSANDFFVLCMLLFIVSVVLYFLLWFTYAGGFWLAMVMFTSSVLWVIRRVCVLDSKRVKYSVAATLVVGTLASLSAYVCNVYVDVLMLVCLVNCMALIYLSLLTIKKKNESFKDNVLSIFADPLALAKSVMLVPLLWFPSNGIYLFLASLGSPAAIVEVRKLLMLLSPIQQISGAMINFVFSKGGGYKVTYLEVWVAPLTITLIVTPVAAILYGTLLHGTSEGIFMWAAFALIVFAMIVISLLQSNLRVLGKQASVIASLAVAVAVKLSFLFGFYSFGEGGVGVTDSLVSMAAAYALSALFLYIYFVNDKRISRWTR